MEVASGRLPQFTEAYAQWLSEQPSFQNMNNRAFMGRVRALRALRAKLRAMLPTAGWTDDQIYTITCDIRDLAKLKAGSLV